MSWGLFAAGAGIALLDGMAWAADGWLIVLILIGMLETGIANLPWPFVLTGAAALGWVAGGWRLAALSRGAALHHPRFWPVGKGAAVALPQRCGGVFLCCGRRPDRSCQRSLGTGLESRAPDL